MKKYVSTDVRDSLVAQLNAKERAVEDVYRWLCRQRAEGLARVSVDDVMRRLLNGPLS